MTNNELREEWVEFCKKISLPGNPINVQVIAGFWLLKLDSLKAELVEKFEERMALYDPESGAGQTFVEAIKIVKEL